MARLATGNHEDGAAGDYVLSGGMVQTKQTVLFI